MNNKKEKLKYEKLVRNDAITDAIYTCTKSKSATLAHLVGEKVQSFYNWHNRGSVLAYELVVKIYQKTGVSPYRLAPQDEIVSDMYFSRHPKLNIFKLDISIIDPAPIVVNSANEDVTRPIIVGLRNVLIYGHKHLQLARQSGHTTIDCIRLDAQALLECKPKILKRPQGWLNCELHAIANFLEHFAKTHRIKCRHQPQDLQSYIFSKLRLSDQRISKAHHSTLFKPNCKPSSTVVDDNCLESTQHITYKQTS